MPTVDKMECLAPSHQPPQRHRQPIIVELDALDLVLHLFTTLAPITFRAAIDNRNILSRD